MKKDIQLIIFDLDGTIIQNPLFYKTVYSQSLTNLIQELRGKEGLKVLSYFRNNYQGRGELALPALAIPYSLWAQRLEKLPLQTVKKNMSLVKKIRSLRSKKVIYTGSPLKLAKKLLLQTGFRLSDFDEIIGWEKPEEFPLKWTCSSYVFECVCKKININPTNVLTVGDSWETDLLPAEKLGILIIDVKNKEFLIAGGNPTILSDELSEEKRKAIIKKYLGKKVDQIGFISKDNGMPNLLMMGNELCVNATLAFASTLDKTGYLKTSGIENDLYYKNSEDTTTVIFPLEFQQYKNILIFPGIGFLYSDNNRLLSKKILKKYCNYYNCPAFGFISYQENKLKPFIYVRSTNSFIEESACGSGSIALNILLGIEDIVQPSGGIISVKRRANTFAVTAKVDTISIL